MEQAMEQAKSLGHRPKGQRLQGQRPLRLEGQKFESQMLCYQQFWNLNEQPKSKAFSKAFGKVFGKDGGLASRNARSTGGDFDLRACRQSMWARKRKNWAKLVVATYFIGVISAFLLMKVWH